MNFIKKFLLKHKKKKIDSDNWDEIVYTRDGINFDKDDERNQYITDCLEQIAVSSKEIEQLSMEYGIITTYLTDIEEFERLPKREKENIILIAKKLQIAERDCKLYHNRKTQMSDTLFHQLKVQENEIEDGIYKLREAENYGLLIKQDLQRLDSEKHASDYQHTEVFTLMSNLKGMAIIFLTALILCLIMLMVLQFGFHMDTKVGYFVSVISAAIAISILCIKYMEADKELQRIENKNNKIIQLQNKVKIRYINNKNLKDYLCIKFNVEHSKILEKLHTQYLKEKEERAQFAEASEKAEFLQEDLVALLKRYRIKYPERFMNQVEAILDNKELIEYRHELIIQRQALRKQIEHNNELIHKAKHEITDIVIMYPKYATEITALVDLYDKKF